METISQRELRNDSGAVLRRVAAGETLMVTNGGVPAAILSPVPRDARERLIAEGQIRPARLPDLLAALPPRVCAAVPSSQVIDDDRGER